MLYFLYDCADIITDPMIDESEDSSSKENAFVQLKSRLTREEMKETLAHPIIETFTSGKSVVDVVQRFIKWVTSFGRSNH